MTQYKKKVDLQRAILKAEAWGKEPYSIETHRLKSNDYDTRPEDTDRGYVTDTRYNNGTIVREQFGKVIHVFGKPLSLEHIIFTSILYGIKLSLVIFISYYLGAINKNFFNIKKVELF